MKRPAIIVLVILVATVLLAAGCVSKSTYNQKVEELETRIGSLEEQLAAANVDKTELQDQLDQVLARGWLGDRVIVYFVYNTETSAYLVPVIQEVEFSKGSDPRRLALEALLAGPGPDSTLERPLPAGVRLLNLEVDDRGVATVDLSREVMDLNVGARGEALALAAIVNTLTEFPEVDRVQILIEGEAVETLAGHVDISKPLERDEGMVLR